MSNNCRAILTIPKEQIDALLELFPYGIAALDTETTGLSPLVDEIVELASIKVTKKGVELFQSLVKPTIAIPENVIKIHGITDEMVADAPAIAEVLKSWFDHIQDLPIIAHNAQFDLGFLAVAAFHQKLDFKNRKVYCSCLMARKILTEAPNHKLSTISKYLEISLENHHRASDDTMACLQSVAKMIILAKEKSMELPKILTSSFVKQSQDLKPNSLSALPKHLKGLAPYVRKQEEIDIVYQGGSHKDKFRPIKPIGLMPVNKGQALYALCLLSQQHKFFSLHKIKEFRPRNDPEE